MCNTRALDYWRWKIYQNLALRHFDHACTMVGSAREEQTDVTMALVRDLTTPPIVRSKPPAAALTALWKMVRAYTGEGLSCAPLDNVDR